MSIATVFDSGLKFLLEILVISMKKSLRMMICMHSGEQKCQNGPENQMISKLRLENRKFVLTHWGRETHICVGEHANIGLDNGLSPNRRQAIIWTNAGILLIEPLGTNFNEILIEIYTFSFKKMHLKMSSAKWRPCCLGLNELNSLWAICSLHCNFSSCSDVQDIEV